jgi:hypothetical protein
MNRKMKKAMGFSVLFFSKFKTIGIIVLFVLSASLFSCVSSRSFYATPEDDSSVEGLLTYEEYSKSEHEKEEQEKKQSLMDKINSPILAYFPAKEGATWVYANRFDEITDIEKIDRIINSDYNFRIMASHEFVVAGTTHAVYEMENNTIILTEETNLAGITTLYTSPKTILSLPEDYWYRYVPGNQNNEYTLCEFSNASISFDGKIYNDCILLTESTYISKELATTKRTYYANGIGLIYITLQSPGEKENAYMKLVEYHIPD